MINRVSKETIKTESFLHNATRAMPYIYADTASKVWANFYSVMINLIVLPWFLTPVGWAGTNTIQG